MERPTPTKEIILELTGNNQGLISAIHHGLNETSLRDFYSKLDLDEVVAFEASSWKSRKENQTLFDGVVHISDIYTLFNEVYKIGMPWINKHKKISEDLKPLYMQLNPFKGKDLRERLESIDQESVEVLKRNLQKDVNQYVFECQYHDAKMKNEPRGENFGIVMMEFQPVYPEAGKIVPSFAKEISKMLSFYPKEYKHLEKPQLPLL